MDTKNAKKGAVERTPPDKLLLDFMKENKLVLILDEISIPVTDVKDTIYSVTKKQRARVFYLDQIEKEESNHVDNPQVEITN